MSCRLSLAALAYWVAVKMVLKSSTADIRGVIRDMKTLFPHCDKGASR